MQTHPWNHFAPNYTYVLLCSSCLLPRVQSTLRQFISVCSFICAGSWRTSSTVSLLCSQFICRELAVAAAEEKWFSLFLMRCTSVADYRQKLQGIITFSLFSMLRFCSRVEWAFSAGLSLEERSELEKKIRKNRRQRQERKNDNPAEDRENDKIYIKNGCQFFFAFRFDSMCCIIIVLWCSSFFLARAIFLLSLSEQLIAKRIDWKKRSRRSSHKKELRNEKDEFHIRVMD